MQLSSISLKNSFNIKNDSGVHIQEQVRDNSYENGGGLQNKNMLQSQDKSCKAGLDDTCLQPSYLGGRSRSSMSLMPARQR
jgi:hypothetical protein